MSDLSIKDVVQRTYGDVAKSASSADKSATSAIAQAFGYSVEELSAIPEESNLGLSCGNPTAFASLKPGETVVDLGSGGGLDVFLAARCVGPSGKAIGIDMTPEMIALAQKNAKSAKDSDGKILTNVEFYLGTIDRIPVPDQSVDCVISNCVINLAADKNAVFQEIARILKPGGRLAASDLALKQDLPEELAADALAWAACISGAIKLDDYEKQKALSLVKHEIKEQKSDVTKNIEGCDIIVHDLDKYEDNQEKTLKIDDIYREQKCDECLSTLNNLLL